MPHHRIVFGLSGCRCLPVSRSVEGIWRISGPATAACVICTILDTHWLDGCCLFWFGATERIISQKIFPDCSCLTLDFGLRWSFLLLYLWSFRRKGILGIPACGVNSDSRFVDMFCCECYIHDPKDCQMACLCVDVDDR